MRTVGSGFTGHATVETCAALASKSGYAVVGVIATGVGAETTLDGLIASVGRISAILIDFSGAAAGNEAA